MQQSKSAPDTPTVIVKGGIIEAPPDGTGGPRWIATLDDGTVVVGRPSWATATAKMRLPHDPAFPETDWRRLMRRCAEENRRLKSISLFVPGKGHFTAPENRAGYGYYERYIGAINTPEAGIRGCQAVSICYWDSDRKITKEIRVYADGILEHQDRFGWLPCMIGTQEEPGVPKHPGVLTERAHA